MRQETVCTLKYGFILAAIMACAPIDPTLIPVRGGLPIKYGGPATSPAITAGDLMTRLYIFADDSMLGRRAGDIGNLKGTAYIEHEVRRLGLKPGGENGTFFQDVPLVVRTPVASLHVGNDSLVLNTDYTVGDGRARTREWSGLPAVYGGAAGADPKDMISVADARGKIIVIRGIPRSPVPALREAAGVVVVLDDLTFGFVRSQGRGRAIIRPVMDTTTEPARFLVSSSIGAKLFGSPIESLHVGAVGQTLTGAVRFNELAVPGRNVVAIVPGSDPMLRGEYVALGAHNDHLGLRAQGPLDHDSVRAFNQAIEKIVIARTGVVPSVPGSGATPAERASIHVNVDSLRRIRPARLDSVYNGADDDGSGSVGLLEIAEYFATSPARPRRSLLFVWHTGEEAGLLGSLWFTNHPTVLLDSVVGQINIDMIGRGAGSEPGKSDRYVQVLGSRRISKEMGDLVDAVAAKPEHGLPLDYAFDAPGHPERYYCRSDHWNYARMGIPITFLSDGNHVDYHQITDEPQYIDYSQFARVVLLTEDIVQAVANLDHRLVNDKPKPSPNAACVQ